ncbi:ABC transporter substrate-binding protein [Nakamurella flavida]|uniref:ABC transporter substrate-binding protein n=1 Tax=Nakamurella flavida TaxID=363630 RepID=A0A939C4I9_9ACTN|nr:ABC transporter substrate-binding protein [Nakamurella flavida]MBM9478141.1 ABC transporter substrate-binding protein [Nakamurella flavida]MDP9778637.1 peptide/nickel transport system substrate-binding protein [Nakamurella flavida]
MAEHIDATARAEALAQGFLAGRIDRRRLLRSAMTLGGAAVAATTLGPLLVACGAGGTTASSGAGGASSAAAGEPVAGGTLTVALTGNPTTMDPASAGVYTSLQVIDNIFDKLLTMDENGELVGVLASSWKQDDPKTYTFDLVTTTFHNGEAFTADDVKYTFERILDPATASSYASAYAAVDTIEVASPTQVVFHLKDAYAPFLTNLAQNGEIVNRKAVEAADPTRAPVGTGPFTFVEWLDGDHVTLAKNPNYHQAGKPYLDQITFRFLDVDTSRIESLQSGELDWVDAVPLNQLTTLKADPSYTYATSTRAGIPDFLALNTSRAPFDNLALRQAVAAAVGRPDVLSLAYFGAGEQGVMEVPSGSEWFGGEPPYSTGPDLELAKKKMIEAGYPDGLTVTYLALPQYPELAKTGVVLRDQLKNIGITVEIEQLEVTVWFGRYADADYDMTSAYWSGTLDPDNFYSTQLVSGSANNTTKYANPDLDALVTQAAQSSDDAARKELYIKIRDIVWEDAPLVFLHYETINYLMRPDVQGSVVNPLLELNFKNVWKTA